MKKISIITPCFNAENYIEETIDSVTTQTAVLDNRIELEYIICDGSSTDKTLEIIENFKSPSIELLSGNDTGIYDALSKGLKRASGDVIGYINAGDYYHKTAFDIVLEIFKSKPVYWLTGYNIAYNESSQIVKIALPFKYRKRLFECGYYNGKVLPHVQAESTFWKAELLEEINYQELSNFKLAGDFYIWYNFSKIYNLNIVRGYLGGFRTHAGQLSKDVETYYSEMNKIISRKKNLIDTIIGSFDFVMWKMPARAKKILNQKEFFQFDLKFNEWI